MAGPSSQVITAAYKPAPVAQNFHFVATTAIATAQRLGTLIAVPVITDEMFTLSSVPASGMPGGLPPTRPPNHVIFAVPSTAANSIWLTWDNNTTPVVGGPGYEITVGQSILFENAGLTLLRPKSAGTYQVNALTAFQFIASAATNLLVDFAD